MPYAKLLNNLIEKSGMTAKEIADKCTEQGQKITASYISILRNENNNRVPSDELSKVLAKTLNVDENLFVIEACLDNAPQPIIKAFRNIYKQTVAVALNALGKEITEEQKQLFSIEMDKQSLSEFILELNKEMDMTFIGDLTVIKSSDGSEKYTTEISKAIDFGVTDNSLYPIICDGDRAVIQIQEKYISGDIVAFKTKDNDIMRFRKLQIDVTGKIVLLSYNSEYPNEEHAQGSIQLIAKVVAVTKKI